MPQEMEAMGRVLALISALMALLSPSLSQFLLVYFTLLTSLTLIPLPAHLINALKRRLLWNEINHEGSRSGPLRETAVKSGVG